MSAWFANALALFLGLSVVVMLALALLWQVGSWQLPRAATLTLDEGLRIGATALEVAGYTDDGTEVHLSFAGPLTFLVFGTQGCRPCEQLLEAAGKHPATRPMRKVYVWDGRSATLDPDVLDRWEVYRFHNEEQARKHWRAPVSPYFHVIDEAGRIADKGVANQAQHLDRLLQLKPGLLRPHLITANTFSGGTND